MSGMTSIRSQTTKTLVFATFIGKAVNLTISTNSRTSRNSIQVSDFMVHG